MVNRAGDLLRQYMAEKGWSFEDPCARVFLQWNAIVGEPLCAHSRPLEINDGILTVRVDHPGWLQVFQIKKAEILRSLGCAAPGAKLRDLRARL